MPVPQIDALLKENRLRPAYLFNEVATRVIAPSELIEADAILESLRNVNTLEDYEQALVQLRPDS